MSRLGVLSGKLEWRLRLLVLLVLVALAPSIQPTSVRGQSADISVVYVSPTTTYTNNTFSVQVLMDLASDEHFNTYDIRLNYNSTPYGSTVLKVVSESAKPGSDEFIRCLDGVGLGCDLSDTTGVIHSAADFPYILDGPQQSFPLFSVQFAVIGKGVKVLHPLNDSIINPLQGAHPILHMTQDGIYSNLGPTAFFNTAPAILIASQPVTFDGTGSFDPSGTGTFSNYSWSFGDGTPGKLGAIVQHDYASPGSYDVTLNVTDSNGSGSLTKTISVVSGLGGLRVNVLQVDYKYDHAVTVSLFNGTVLVGNPVTRPAFLTGVFNFQNLEPGSYRLNFSGPGIVPASANVNVVPGWTTWYTAYLSLVQPPADNGASDVQFFLILGAVAGGIILGSGALVRRRLRRKKRR